MELRINLKPAGTIKRHSVETARASVRHNFRGSYGMSYTTYGSGVIISSCKEYYYVFCIHKVRPKKERTPTGWRIVKKGYAEATYYKIPVAVLKAMGKKVVQKSRHFELEDV